MKFIKKYLYLVLILISVFSFTGCFSEKKSPFYDSHWMMTNIDNQNQNYYHQLFLNPNHTVDLKVSYFGSSNIIVWRGTYKITSKKITFKFNECIRFENGAVVGNYSDARFIKYYNGEYLYSVAQVGDSNDEDKVWALQLIRPKNQIMGDTVDIFGNHFEEFYKTE